MKQFVCSLFLVPWMTGIVVAHVLVPAQEAVAATVQLNWTDNSNNETSFTVERRAADQTGAWDQVGSVGANVVTYNDTVPAGMGACYQVKAVGAGGTSGASNEACVSIPAVIPPPTAPGNVTITITGTGMSMKIEPTPPQE